MAELTEEHKKRWGLGRIPFQGGAQTVNEKTFDAGLDTKLNTEPTSAEEEAAAPTGTTFSDWLQQIQAEKERREQDDADAERRGKLREMIGSIGDAAVALNNLYHTTQYAPAPKAAEGMGDAYAERNAQDKAWRDAHRREWLNYALNIAGKKQAEDNATETQAYRDKQLDLYNKREERMQQEADRRDRMAEWQQEYQQGNLDLKKAQIELRKWIEQGKMSRSQINHNLASWKKTKRYILDERGKKIGEEEERIVMNPDGTLTTESSIRYDNGQDGRQQSTKPQQQSGGKYSNVNKNGGKTDYTHVNKKSK